MDGGLPQLDTEWFPSQLFWLGVTFCILYGYFSRVALPRITNILATRQEKIADDVAQADALNHQAQEIRAAYERDMARARDKAAQTFKDMNDRVKQKTTDQLYAFRTKFTAEIARAEDTMARERARVIDDMNTIAAETAAQATSVILQTPADLSSAQAIVNNLQRPRAA